MIYRDVTLPLRSQPTNITKLSPSVTDSRPSASSLHRPGPSIEEEGIELKAHGPGSIIQRGASVEDVARMIVYAASPQATGAALRVDGGVIDPLM